LFARRRYWPAAAYLCRSTSVVVIRNRLLSTVVIFIVTSRSSRSVTSCTATPLIGWLLGDKTLLSSCAIAVDIIFILRQSVHRLVESRRNIRLGMARQVRVDGRRSRVVSPDAASSHRGRPPVRSRHRLRRRRIPRAFDADVAFQGSSVRRLRSLSKPFAGDGDHRVLMLNRQTHALIHRAQRLLPARSEPGKDRGTAHTLLQALIILLW
jgi:hypothetical protein